MKLLQPVTGCEDEGGGLHHDDYVSSKGESDLRWPPMKTTKGQPPCLAYPPSELLMKDVGRHGESSVAGGAKKG